MDNLCQYVNSVINIDAERDLYTHMCDHVRNNLINGLKEDPHFKELFCGVKICGSYADNLKVSKPDEFDLVVCLRFPHNECVKISPDNKNVGNVFIDISEVLVRLQPEKNKNAMLKFLEKMTNRKNYFLEDKFQSWLQGRVTKYFSKINNMLVYTDGSNLHLHYSKQGPAHTIRVSKFHHEFSIDFVPAFVFEASKSVSKRKVISTHWMAVPKPIGVKDNPSFRTSYTESERIIIANKNQLKTTLRMMKKFRDTKPKMVNLKSYHLKTLFLWHNDRCSPNFWTKPTIEIIHEMFTVLENALSKQEIPFFWNNKLNLLENLSNWQIISMFHEVAAAKRTLKQSRQIFVSIFLTKEEQEAYEEYEKTEESDMDEMCQKVSRIISLDTERDTKVNVRVELIKSQILSNMRENKDFCLIYNDLKPSGSFADNLRVSKEPKFSYMMCFKFPHNDSLTIIPSYMDRRDISINISGVLTTLNQQNADAQRFLEGMVNSKNCFLAKKFESWFQARICNFLHKNCYQLTLEDGSTASLQYRLRQSSHNIQVSCNEHTFCIAIVPSFLIKASNVPTKKQGTSEYCLAYPKFVPQDFTGNPFFSVSFEESERKIFANKNQLKNVLRMMKKFRNNKSPMVNLKTYYLKTLFLWQNEECNAHFWSQPTINILHVMFKKLEAALQRHDIPFYWHKKENLLKSLTYNQIESMLSEVRRARNILLHAESTNEFLSIFLNKEELSRVLPVPVLKPVVPRFDCIQMVEEQQEEGLSNVAKLGIAGAVAAVVTMSILALRRTNN